MEEQRQKIVNLVFLSAGVLLAYVVYQLLDRVVAQWDLETRIHDIELFLTMGSILSGAILFLVLWKKDNANQFMNEVVVELSRVAWPAPNDTAKATFVVIIMVLISAVVLGAFDALWMRLLEFIL